MSKRSLQFSRGKDFFLNGAGITGDINFDFYLTPYTNSFDMN
jgi:hypothetical protein